MERTWEWSSSLDRVEDNCVCDKHLRWLPKVLTSCYSGYCVTRLLCNLDLLPSNRVWQKWWDMTSIIRLQKTVTSILLYCLLCLHTLMKQADMLGRSKWPVTQGDIWPKALKELNPVNNHVNELEHGSFPSHAFKWDHSLDWYLDC